MADKNYDNEPRVWQIMRDLAHEVGFHEDHIPFLLKKLDLEIGANNLKRSGARIDQDKLKSEIYAHPNGTFQTEGYPAGVTMDYGARAGESEGSKTGYRQFREYLADGMPEDSPHGAPNGDIYQNPRLIKSARAFYDQQRGLAKILNPEMINDDPEREQRARFLAGMQSIGKNNGRK